jgi:folate-binding Fe-S cluster repair protein YgfZ
MQYRGTLKKGMYRIAGSGTAPLPNEQVFHEEQSIGHMVMAENITVNQWEGLAVITHEAVQHITVLPLPYTVTPSENPAQQ